VSWRWILAACLLAACGGEEAEVPPVADSEVAPVADSEVAPDLVPDGSPEVGPTDVTYETVDISGAPALELELVIPRCAANLPCPFRVRHAIGVTTGPVSIQLDGEGRPGLTLRMGQGSGVLSGLSAGDHALVFVFEGAAAAFDLEVKASDTVEHEGLVASQIWAADVIHSLTSDLSIDGDLKISPGVRVIVAPGVNLEISGAMTVLGTAELPVLFTRSGASAWGGLRLVGQASSELHHVFFTAGGGDTEKIFGHSDSQPVVRLKAGHLTMSGGAVLDSPGKAFGCTEARITLADVLVARVDTGGELDRCGLIMEGGHVSEIPDADGVATDDDNDGIYLLGVLFGDDDIPVESVIRSSYFGAGEDDGIDHNDALVRVENSWIEDFAHEGVAASVGNRIAVVDSVIRGCEQGIEAGYGQPAVEVDRCLVTDNGTGLRFGDSYDWGADGTLIVTHTVAVGNETNVRNHLNSTGEPHPTGLQIACSMVDDPAWDEVANNVAGAPEIVGGCAQADALVSPCDEVPPGPSTCP
jgi:hypothetical protein